MNRAAGFELTINRTIRAPREKVFDAFIKPEAMARWMGPRGMALTAEADARVGGRYRVTMRSRDGDSFSVGGVYREIARQERIVYTWQWEQGPMPGIETLISVQFSDKDGGTELRMTHSGFPDAAMRDSHHGGWDSCLARLTDISDPRGTAASVVLLGDPRSTYTRTVRIGFAEKGLNCTFQRTGPHTPEVLGVNPFGRIPAFRDGDIKLFETSAILRYVEEAFPGPTLLPQSIRDRAIGEQWVSAINGYFDGVAIRRYVLSYVFPKGPGGQPDRTVIDASVKQLPGQLSAFEQGYTRPFLAGQNPTMADFFLAPIIGYLEMFPESKAMLPEYPKLMRAHAAMKERASWKETQPQ